MSFRNETYDIVFERVHPAPCPICPTTSGRVVEPEESDPTVDVLDDQTVSNGASITLGVSYHANSPVTIIWRVNHQEISQQTDRIPHGQTHATLNRFTHIHHGKRYEVEIVDNRGQIVSTSCKLNMRF